MRGIRPLVLSVAFVAAVVGVAVAGFATGTRPLLGLDLVGGVQVILTAPQGTGRDVLERALENIRNRVDALGVAEPEIFLSGNNIEVQIPEVSRGTIVERGGEFCVESATGKALGCFGTREEAEARVQETGQARLLELIGKTARLEQREALEVVSATDPAFEEMEVTCATPAERLLPSCSNQALEDEEVVYLSEDGETKFRLGPVLVTGDAIKRATAVFTSSTTTGGPVGWEVTFELTPEGARTFADVTERLVGKQLAIVLDRRVQSAPTVQTAIAQGVGQITGAFTEQEAKDLATVLNAGALPVELERSSVQTVSPTLGRESLRQGLIAGVAGLAALAVYLVFYYRLLGVVTWFGMAIWAVLAIGLVAALGRAIGYSLTLAGVAGIVVSLGITADSYIVFYERLKDEVRQGKTLRAAVSPAFHRAWRTIIAADVVTILAAAILYLVAISSVRGFALTLGLATALDMFVVYFFKRPTVFLIARSPFLANLPGMGLRRGVAATAAPVAGGER